jgi:uncharacterized membrane protein
MAWKPLVAGLVAGLSAFLSVGVVVTSVAERWIEFSLFLGLPAGILAGLSVGAFVAVRLARNRSRSDQLQVGQEQAGNGRLPVATVWFVIAFLVTVAVLAGTTNSGLTITFGGGAIVGLIGGALGYRTGWPLANRRTA